MNVWKLFYWGILIDSTRYFFEMPYQKIEEIKKIVGTKKTRVYVSYYDEPDSKTGALGSVIRIELQDKPIYELK